MSIYVRANLSYSILNGSQDEGRRCAQSDATAVWLGDEKFAWNNGEVVVWGRCRDRDLILAEKSGDNRRRTLEKELGLKRIHVAGG